MNGTVLLLVAAVGVDYGWQPDGQGELEYIIQVEPLLLETLKDGDDIVSRVPADAIGVRSFRIRVGTGQLPREGLPVGEPAAANPQSSPPADSQKNLRPESSFVPPSSNAFQLGDGNGQTANSGSTLSNMRQSPNVVSPPGDYSPYTPDPSSRFSPRQPVPIRDPQLPAQSQLSAPQFEDAAVPATLTPDPGSEPLSHQTASYSEADKTFPGDDVAGPAPVAQPGASNADASSLTDAGESAESRPWWPLTLTAMGLFASVGLNFYLGLVARGVYRRYRTLVDEMRSAGSATAGT